MTVSLCELPTELHQEVEAIPASYPATPVGLSTEAQALDPDMIWQRIEAYCGWRWSAREVVWVVQGPGMWAAPLKPATFTATEEWNVVSEDWDAVTLSATPLGGYLLPNANYHRFSATVGAGATVPAAVEAAFIRLAEYMAETDDRPGVTHYDQSIDGTLSESYHRNAAWIAKALHNCGAGDLLRMYRRLK